MMTGIKEKASTAHIAIVEDDALVRESLSDCLESAGYSVQTFGSAEEFLALPLRRPSLRTILLHFYLVASLFTVGSEITSIWLLNCGVHDMAQISSANHDANKVQAIRAGSGALMTKERCPMLVSGGIQCNHPATVVPQSWEVPPYCVPGRPVCEECYRELRAKAFGSWAA